MSAVDKALIFLEALGAEVELPDWCCEYFENAKEDGCLWDGPITHVAGTPGLCQVNSVRLCSVSPNYRIWIGWALSESGKWAAHVCAHDGRSLIEATSPRKAYFGIVLNEKDTASFMRDYEGM
jgi:hypothetical protein